MKRLLVAPFDLHQRLLALIEREEEHARAGSPARIVARMNSLVDPAVIRALYRASQAGVRIDLIVRGVCCLRPGVPGLSKSITVRSIVDRFLEHSRIFHFENGCQPEAYMGSADWMPRNFFRRIETVFPILDGILRERIYSELLGVTLADNQRARILLPDGKYHRLPPVRPGRERRSQFQFIGLANDDFQRKRILGGKRNKYPVVTLAASPFKR